MAAQRSHALLLCCLVILQASHEVQGLFECLKGCPTKCQQEFHESLYVCAIFCGMRCTCTGGAGNCSFLAAKHQGGSENHDLLILEAARQQAAAATAPASPVSTAQSPPNVKVVN